MHELVDQLADPDQNVVLTGFMGTGKSTTGRRLAGRLGFDFVDTDRLIEEQHGTVADLFENEGEARFREIERETAATLALRHRHVVSTGGRLLLDPDNERTLGGSGKVICLHADVDEILRRVLSSRSGVRRPLLEGPDPAGAVRALLTERSTGYRRFPQLSTEGLGTDAVAAALARLATTPPTVIESGERTIAIGIGVAARAEALGLGSVATVIDVGRIQPDRGLTAAELIAIQNQLADAFGES